MIAQLDEDLRLVAPRQRRGPTCSQLGVLLLASLLVVAGATLWPHGTGWAWGSPLVELQWYVSLSDGAPAQLVGNLVLLAPSAGLAVVLWPALGRLPVIARAGLAAGTVIELLQRILPLGRVVSPIDVALNAGGAILAGCAVVHARACTRPALPRSSGSSGLPRPVASASRSTV